MGQEIEKKFLLKSDVFKKEAAEEVRIIQGYLSSIPERIVRVRVKGIRGFLTIKGIGNRSGASRFEWEKEIPIPEAEELLELCEPGVIDKVRYSIIVGKHTFEVDEFYGENLGLTVAEVELNSEDEAFDKPSWLGKEVTGDSKYYNSMLLKAPFTRWERVIAGRLKHRREK